MFLQIALLIVSAGIEIKAANAIECFSCTNVTRLPDCAKRISCPSGSTCFSEYTYFEGKHLHTLGCKSIWSCPVQTTGSSGGVSSIVGRAVSGSANCSECCSTSNCNRRLCQNEDPTCNDDHGYDCASIGVGFNICDDVTHAKLYCRRFCGFCNTVDGNWSSWSEWSFCDVTCGTGTRTKSRACSNPAPENGGSDCPGENKLHENCTKEICPVNGGWSKWSDWGTCSVTCDIGLQRRDRSCSDPYPARYGDHCYGDSRSDRLCFPGACANGSWSSWSSWGPCDKTCDGGVKTRTRDCDNPVPSLTGNYCSGETTEAESCNISPCQDGNWSSWSSWGSCDKSCDGGEKSRTRDCDNPAPSLTGRYCSGETTEAESCNISPCQGPVVFLAKELPGGARPTLAVNAALRFTNVITNVGHGYDSSTGFFTAPVNGTYSFNVQFCVYSGNAANVELFVNDVRVTNMYMYGDSYHSCRTFSVPVILKQGDKVQAKIGSGSNTQAFYQDSNRIISFSGVLI